MRKHNRLYQAFLTGVIYTMMPCPERLRALPLPLSGTEIETLLGPRYISQDGEKLRAMEGKVAVLFPIPLMPLSLGLSLQYLRLNSTDYNAILNSEKVSTANGYQVGLEVQTTLYQSEGDAPWRIQFKYSHELFSDYKIKAQNKSTDISIQGATEGYRIGVGVDIPFRNHLNLIAEISSGIQHVKNQLKTTSNFESQDVKATETSSFISYGFLTGIRLIL